MNTLRVYSLYVFCFCVFKHTTQVKGCGELSYAVPAIANRYVRLTFKPTPWNSKVKWDVYLNSTSPLQFTKYNSNTTTEKETHILDLKTYADSRMIDIYAYSGSCMSDSLRVNLKHNKPCGLLQLDTQQIKPGGEVVLRYFPHSSFKDNPIPSIETKWRVQNDACPTVDGCEVFVGYGRFRAETRTFYGDKEHRLIIQSMDNTMDGHYFLLCDERRKKYTQTIEVKTPVMPSQPTFHSLKNKTFCGQCLVGQIDKPYTVECEVQEGTAPEIQISVNGKETSYNTSANGIYSRRVDRLTEGHHNVPVRCQVTNYAFTQPLLTTTKLYVARPPSTPVLHLGEIKEGSPMNVTCWSEGGRPAVRLVLTVSGQSVGQARPYDLSANRSDVSLTNISRSWNGEKMKCCANEIIYEEKCSQEHTISYKFPPTAVSVTPPKQFNAIMDNYLLNITCSLEVFNGECEPKWTLDGSSASIVAISNNTVGTHMKNYTQRISVSVKKDDNGKTLMCSADCQEFPDSQKTASHKLVVPYRPEVTFESDSSVLILGEGETRDVKCIVDSEPAATVNWSRDRDGTQLTVDDCGLNAFCMKLERVARNISGNYTCTAKNALSKVVSRQLQIIVNGSEARWSADPTDPGEAGGFPVLVVVIALVAVIVVVLVAIIVVIIRRKSASRKVSVNYTVTATDDQRHEDRASAANNSDPPGHDTYATPLPRSQRPTPQAASTSQDTQAGGAPKELIYADLALASEPASGAAATGRPVVRRTDSETEYVDIDFTKKAAPLPDPGEEGGDGGAAPDNVYANQ